MNAAQSQSKMQMKVKDRLQNIREQLEKRPELSYNDRPNVTIAKESLGWDNWTQFDQFGKWV